MTAVALGRWGSRQWGAMGCPTQRPGGTWLQPCHCWSWGFGFSFSCCKQRANDQPGHGGAVVATAAASTRPSPFLLQMPPPCTDLSLLSHLTLSAPRISGSLDKELAAYDPWNKSGSPLPSCVRSRALLAPKPDQTQAARWSKSMWQRHGLEEKEDCLIQPGEMVEEHPELPPGQKDL